MVKKALKLALSPFSFIRTLWRLVKIYPDLLATVLEHEERLQAQEDVNEELCGHLIDIEEHFNKIVEEIDKVEENRQNSTSYSASVVCNICRNKWHHSSDVAFKISDLECENCGSQAASKYKGEYQ